jgi:hypothetical protein
MAAIVIGFSGTQSHPVKVKLDIDVLLRTRLLVQANSGQGKSFLLRRLAEQLFGKVPLIVVDPEGEFATLREKFDFILIGEGGDAPIHVPSARLLAHRLLELRASAVCNIYDGVLPAARHEWVKNFLDGLIDSPKKLWHPCVVIVDEAHKFGPERKAGESCALEAMTRLASDGRKRGFAAVFATQRLAKLDKSISAELLNRLVGGTFEDVDIDRALDLLSVSKADTFEFKKSLKVLEPGEFYAIGRAITKERLLLKVGPVETRHPDSGSYGRQAAEPPPPTAKVRELLSKLQDLPRAAEQKERTEKELKLEIRELKRQIRVAAKVLPSGPSAAPVVDNRAVQKASVQIEALQKLAGDMYKIIVEQKIRLEKHGKEVTDQSIRVKGEASNIAEAGKLLARSERQLLSRMQALTDPSKKIMLVEHTSGGVNKPAEVKFSLEVKPHRQALPLHAATEIPTDHGEVKLTGSMKKILAAMAELVAVGKPAAPREMVGGWSGYAPNGGGFMNTLGALRSAGLIDYPSPGMIQFTAAGEAMVPQAPPPSREEVQRRILDICTGSERKILQVLIANGTGALSRADVAQGAGYSENGGGFMNTLGALRTKGFIDYPQKGMVQPAEWLFIE